jgi:hypothetical protein
MPYRPKTQNLDCRRGDTSRFAWVANVIHNRRSLRPQVESAKNVHGHQNVEASPPGPAVKQKARDSVVASNPNGFAPSTLLYTI